MPSETRPKYLRDSRHASSLFNQQSTGNVVTENLPKHKFNYFINIVFSSPDAQTSFDDLETITSLVKTFDGPKFSMDTMTLNQYNKKRIVQTKVNFDPISMTLHDVVDGKTVKFWEAYYRYYFKDGVNKLGSDGNPDSTIFANDILSPEFNGDKFGVNLDRILNQPNLIDRIEMYTIHGGSYSRMDFIHPRIQQFSHDTFNYEDTSGVAQLDMQLVYENLIYVKKNEPLNGELLDRFSNGNFSDTIGFYNTIKSPTVKSFLNQGTQNIPTSTNTGTNPAQPGLSNNLSGLLTDSVVRSSNTFNSNSLFDSFQTTTNSFNELSETALSSTLGSVVNSIPSLNGESSSSIFNSLFTITPLNSNSSVFNQIDTIIQNPREAISSRITDTVTNAARNELSRSNVGRGFRSVLSRFT